MNDDYTLNRAKIALREGVSKARVTQIMDLLTLPNEIQNELQRPPAPLNLHSFPERRLRVLVRCGDKTIQLCQWRQLVNELIEIGSA